jgi:Ca2+-transporting ATPase
MKVVDQDVSATYSLLSAAAVIKGLKSHRMGLTNPEADRRHLKQGANEIGPRTESILIRSIAREMKPIFIVAIAGGLSMAWVLQNSLLIVLFVIILVAYLFSLLIQLFEHRVKTGVTNLIPEYASVVRNDQLHRIATERVVIGDLLRIAAGDIVPADMRLLDLQDITVDESLLFEGATHSHKYTYPLGHTAPLAVRHNLVFAGTKVRTGSATGIVFAIGSHTEFGQIVQKSQIFVPERAALHNQAMQQSSYGLWFVVISACVYTLIGWLFGVSTSQLVPGIETLITVGFVTIFPLALIWLYVYGHWSFARFHAQVSTIATLEKLPNVTMLFFNPAIFDTPGITFTKIYIGKTIYTVNGEYTEQTAKITDANSRHVTKKTLHTASLFFEAGVLSYKTRPLQLDGDLSENDTTANAFATLATRVGLNPTGIHADHKIVCTFPSDVRRERGSVICEYDDSYVAFVHGTAVSILDQSTKLWDHEHVRSLTPGDIKRVTAQQIPTLVEGRRATAFAYRILPKDTVLSDLTFEKVEQKLIFLGVAEAEPVAHLQTQALLQSFQNTGVKISLLSDHHHQYVINSVRLAELNDEQLLRRLEKGTATFAHLSANDRQRLVTVAQSGKYTVAITGATLSDIPAMYAADVAITCPTIYTTIASAATTLVEHPVELPHIMHRADSLLQTIRQSRGAYITNYIGILVLILVSSCMSLLYRFPPALTAVQLFAALLLVQPFTIVGLFVRRHSSLLLPKYEDTRQSLMAGIGMAIVLSFTFLGFFAYQAINPAYLDSASVIVGHVTSLLLATLVLCQSTALVINYVTTRLRSAPHIFRIIVSIGLGTTLLLLCSVLYFEPLQNTFGTQPLNSIDWLMAFSTTGIYAIILLALRAIQSQSRHSLVVLHQNTFGKNSDIRI